MINERVFKVIAVSESSSKGYNPDAIGQEIKYNGEKLKIILK